MDKKKLDIDYTKKYYLRNNLRTQLRVKRYFYALKWPIIFEDYLGLNMRYALSILSMGRLLRKYYFFNTQIDFKNCIIERDHDNVFMYYDRDILRIDDIIDLLAGHRSIHQAILMDDQVLVDYLIQQDAHLMARDWNGVTPLIKACALGRLEIVKKLVKAGVPINHMDPWGSTPKDKAILYDQRQVIEYLDSLPKNINSEKIEFWKKKSFKEKFEFTPWFFKQF
jgi:hypothetical protein